MTIECVGKNVRRAISTMIVMIVDPIKRFGFDRRVLKLLEERLRMRSPKGGSSYMSISSGISDSAFEVNYSLTLGSKKTYARSTQRLINT